MLKPLLQALVSQQTAVAVTLAVPATPAAAPVPVTPVAPQLLHQHQSPWL